MHILVYRHILCDRKRTANAFHQRCAAYVLQIVDSSLCNDDNPLSLFFLPSLW
jgi:hypothetical protein